jgi:hypothetical protein
MNLSVLRPIYATSFAIRNPKSEIACEFHFLFTSDTSRSSSWAWQEILAIGAVAELARVRGVNRL